MLGLGLLAAACSSNTDADSATPTPTPVPGDATPLPVPGLTFGSDLGPGGRLTGGTHCWAGRCVDMAGPRTAQESFVLPTGTGIDLLFEGVQPSEVEHYRVPVPENPDREIFGQSYLWLDIAAGSYISGAVTAPSSPGEYILNVFARWDEGGDYSFAGYFDVR